ncbi:MAG: hypothetical protein CMJ64_29560 [Planctomycetaceae bacterium]|nr:hypothetical protein [Planctomycetaceae bacterium]
MGEVQQVTLQEFKDHLQACIQGIRDAEKIADLDCESAYEWGGSSVREIGDLCARFGLSDLYRESRELVPQADPHLRQFILSPVLATQFIAKCVAAASELAERRHGPSTPAPSARKSPRAKRNANDAAAVSLLIQNPEWTMDQIAEQVGVSRRTLYNYPEFRRAWGAAGAKDTSRIPRGSKSSSGKIEAVAPVPLCVACNDPAVTNENGVAFCSACFFALAEREQQAY